MDNDSELTAKLLESSKELFKPDPPTRWQRFKGWVASTVAWTWWKLWGRRKAAKRLRVLAGLDGTTQKLTDEQLLLLKQREQDRLRRLREHLEIVPDRTSRDYPDRDLN